MSPGANQRQLDAIHDALQSIREEPLYDWVAVAIWGDGPRGEVSVIGEAPLLHLKGYLHSGVWKAAHVDKDAEPQIVAKDMDKAKDVRQFEGGRMDVVRIAGSSIGRGTFQPGWRWSESVGPLIGEDSCPLAHTGFIVQGRMHIEMDDGTAFELGAGEAIHIAPGHDAWTVGDEECVIVEVLSAEEYAKTEA